MFQYLLDNLRVFNARYNLYLATAFLARLNFDGKEFAFISGPKSSNKPCSWQILNSQVIHSLVFSGQHAFSVYSAAEGRPARTRHEIS